MRNLYLRPAKMRRKGGARKDEVGDLMGQMIRHPFNESGILHSEGVALLD